MKKILVILPLILMIVACGDGSKLKDAIRQNLKDPGSAEFKDMIISTDKKSACIVWNAKNSMGGYSSWDVAELTKENSQWTVKKMDGNPQNCTEIAFKAIDAGEKERNDARQRAIATLQKVKNISNGEAINLAYKGECFNLVWDYSYTSGALTESRLRQDSTMLQLNEKKLKEVQVRLDDGNCKRS